MTDKEKIKTELRLRKQYLGLRLRGLGDVITQESYNDQIKYIDTLIDFIDSLQTKP